jgi:beta-barrel assembly-enhancing protease
LPAHRAPAPHKCNRWRASLGRALALAVACTFALPQAAIPQSRQAINLPNLGDESASVLPPALERKIGENIYRQIRRDASYIDDAEVTYYLSQVGDKLMSAAPAGRQDVTFFALKDGSINAFALLGGFIGVNSGLLTAAQSESEFASVIAHEIAHLTQKHIARGVSKEQQSAALPIAALILGLLVARSNPELASGITTAGQAIPVAQALEHSRDFEREADRIGFQMLEAAGFDPQGMVTFFQRLQRVGRVYETNAPTYLRTHPVTLDRITDIQQRMRNVRYRQRTDSPDFWLARARVRVLADTSVAGLEDSLRALTAAQATAFKEQAVDDIAVRYGISLAQLLANNIAAAERTFAPIVALGAARPKSPMLDLHEARLKTARADHAGAVAVLERARRTYPDANAVFYAWVEAQQAASKHAVAAAALQDRLGYVRGDSKLHALNAKSQYELGKRSAHHLSLAEQYHLEGAVPGAIEQLRAARRVNDGNFQEMSIIDAKLCDWQAQYLQEQAEEYASRGALDKLGSRPPPRASARCG